MRNVLLSFLTAAALGFAGSAAADCSGADHAAMSASLDKAPAASIAPSKASTKPVVNKEVARAKRDETKAPAIAKKDSKSDTVASAQVR